MTKTKFESFVDMENINDSMELDSGTEVARLTTETPMGTLVCTLEIRGYVSVFYEGSHYRRASAMPSELIAMFHDWKEEYSKIVCVDDNNWPEVFLWVKSGDKLEWTGDSELVDAEGMSMEEIELMMREYVTECTVGSKQCVG